MATITTTTGTREVSDDIAARTIGRAIWRDGFQTATMYGFTLDLTGQTPMIHNPGTPGLSEPSTTVYDTADQARSSFLNIVGA